ncbi:MAG: c-type cytochrome biogenesis protein CcmI [Rudaea sp.]
MTTVFLVCAALMLAAALAFILPPLLRGASVAPPTDARRRLRALEQAHDEGVLSETEYAQKRAALGEALLAATGGDAAARPSAGRAAALALALLLLLAAIVGYRIVGTPAALDPAALATHEAAAPADHGGDMDAAIGKLVDRLKQNPGDAGGWALLGRAYRATQHFDAARDALKHANELAPDDADILVEYAEALALSSPQHRIAGEPRALLDKALKINAQNQHALWLSGIADSQEKNYAGAIATWNRLLPLLPRDSTVETSVRKQIAQAEALRDGRPPPVDDEVASSDAAVPEDIASPPASTPAGGAGDGPHIAVKVSLDPALKDKVAPGDVLFVYAKAASGPPMPLAIARLTAGQLPTEVTLTDGMGMLPSMKLSQFAQVIVGARISKSGNAIAQSGDLQTVSAPMPNTRSEPLSLTIDKIVQ